MGKKWGSNEDIRIGDIFWDAGRYHLPDYYQVTALRGSTQVVLRAIETESFVQEEISEDSPLYYRRERTRPVPGKFLPEVGIRELMYRGKIIRCFAETVTAWVCPERTSEDRPRVREISRGRRDIFIGDLVLPEDYAPWTPKQIRLLEEYEIAKSERARKWLLEGDKDSPWPECPL